MASPRNQHCANCIGTLSFPVSNSNSRNNVTTTVTRSHHHCREFCKLLQ